MIQPREDKERVAALERIVANHVPGTSIRHVAVDAFLDAADALALADRKLAAIVDAGERPTKREILDAVDQALAVVAGTRRALGLAPSADSEPDPTAEPSKADT